MQMAMAWFSDAHAEVIALCRKPSGGNTFCRQYRWQGDTCQQGVLNLTHRNSHASLNQPGKAGAVVLQLCLGKSVKDSGRLSLSAYGGMAVTICSNMTMQGTNLTCLRQLVRLLIWQRLINEAAQPLAKEVLSKAVSRTRMTDYLTGMEESTLRRYR